MVATLNRWIAYALIAIGVVVAGLVAYLGVFGWLNDGPLVGLQMFGMAAAIGAGLSVAGLALRFAAAAHARRDRFRWLIQVLAVMVGYLAFGLALWTTSLLE